MNKKLAAAPCEACGGLIPLKPIDAKRRGRQRQCRNDDGHSRRNDFHEASTNTRERLGELEKALLVWDDSESETEDSNGKMRSYDFVLEEIQGIFANQKVRRETITPYIHRERRQREGESHKHEGHERRQAHQHVFSQRRASELAQDKRPSKSRSPTDVTSPCFLHPHQNRRKENEPAYKEFVGQTDEHTCSRIDGQLPQDDASNCIFDPLRISPSPRTHAAKSSVHHLGEHSARGETLRGIIAEERQDTSSLKQNNCKSSHGAVDNHKQDATCRPTSESAVERNTQPRMDNDCYTDVLHLYEKCHTHQIDEHVTATLISSPRATSSDQRRGCEERRFHPQPQPQQQIIYRCHQHTVIRHHEGCHLHPRDDPAVPVMPSTRNSRKCQRGACLMRDSNEGSSIQEPAEHTARHRSPKACVKTERNSEQDAVACTQRLSPKSQRSPKSSRCKLHGDCSEQKAPEKVDVCGICCDPKKDLGNSEKSSEFKEVVACTQTLSPKSPRSPKSPTCKLHGDCSEQKVPEKVDVCGICCHPQKDHNHDMQRTLSAQDQITCPAVNTHSWKKPSSSPRKEKIQECHLQGFPSLNFTKKANSKCNEPKDPLVWTPRRVRKPKPCSSVHWLDRIVASQKFPAHILQQFLQGKRKCPPRVWKPKCPACISKYCRDAIPLRDPCVREVAERWDSGSDIARADSMTVPPRRGKLSRLALSRSLITKPLVKLSTSQGPWTTRKEFQVCSECRNPLTKKGGRWKSLLEEMYAGVCDDGDAPKKCTSTKTSCQTIHGAVLPSDCGTHAIDLRCPELYSAFRLHSKLQKVQNETFDRRAAMQVAQTEGIELDQELFDQVLPERRKPNRRSPARRSSKGESPCSKYSCRKQHRREVYRDLCKIVDPPMPVCQEPAQCPLECTQRDAGVQVGNSCPLREEISKWKPSDFSAEPGMHSNRKVQSSFQLCKLTCNTPNWPEQEQHHCYQEPEQSWDEQRWASVVEAGKQAPMEQGVRGTRVARR